MLLAKGSQHHTQEKFWYVVYTFSKKEKFISSTLASYGVETFLPTQKVVRQWSDRRKVIEAPLFANYVFVKISKSEKSIALKIPGVIRLVGDRREECVVPDSEIDKIKQVHNFDNVEVADHTFKEGDQTIILSGPFKGLEGLLVKKNGKQRVAIQITSIRRCIILDISPRFIQKKS